MSWFETAAVIFGIVSVWLSTREHIWSWPTAIVNVLLYVIVFRDAKLYADMGLQVVYAAISVYGWWHWLHGGAGDTLLPVSRTPLRLMLMLALLAGVGSALLGRLADHTSIGHVFEVSAYFPLIGLLTAFLPELEPKGKRT